MKLGPGSLLIAPPLITDKRFSKSVLLVTHNNSSGAFALCLNKPTKHTLASVGNELGIDKELPFQMFWGGPVNNGSIWMIHDKDWENEHTLYVNDKWRITSNESMFYHLADGDAPRTFRMAFGFCSWMPGQLDMELAGTPPFSKRSSWITLEDVSPEFVFETNVNDLWKDATELAGNKAIENWF